MADGARSAALSGHDEAWEKFFNIRDTSSYGYDVRQEMATRFEKAAAHCNDSSLSIACDEDYTTGYCDAAGDHVAFTINHEFITVCNTFFDMGFGGCGKDSMPSTLLHEVTHFSDISNRDIVYLRGCHGNDLDLFSPDALVNADTYRCFANGKSANIVVIIFTANSVVAVGDCGL